MGLNDCTTAHIAPNAAQPAMLEETWGAYIEF